MATNRLATALCATAIGLTGCAGQTINDKMPSYLGHPTSALIGKLGFPTRQDTVAGKKVYVWTTSNFVDGTNYSCTIRAIINEQDIVSTWDLQGNEAGCEGYASRLR